MQTPSRHEPFEPPTMAKRAASYPSLLPSLSPSSFLCPSLHLSFSPSIHTALFGHKPQKSRKLPAHATLLPSFSAVCFCSLFLEKSSCSQAQLLAPPQWARGTSALWQLQTDNINPMKAGGETVTLKQHPPVRWG